MKTHEIINNLYKIENLSEKDKQNILKACEKLAYLQNKLNTTKYE